MINRREPVGNTCPTIDNLIKRINSIEKEIDSLNKLDLDDDVKYSVREIEDLIYRFNDSLEELRSANSSLRDWANNCIEEYDKMEDELMQEINQLTETK